MEHGHPLAQKLCVSGSGQKRVRDNESENDGCADGVGWRSATKRSNIQ